MPPVDKSRVEKPLEKSGGKSAGKSDGRSAGKSEDKATAAPVTDGRVARAAQKREERRAQVLDTARRLFAERGYHATSIGDIIEAAAIARGTFYLYFESKRAVFETLLDDFFAHVQSTVRRIDVSPGALPPMEQMQDNVRRLLAMLEEEREMARVLLRGSLGIDDEFDRKLGDFYGRVSELIERGLRLGIELGLVRPLDPAVVAWCILGSIKEAADRVLLGASSAQKRGAPVDIEALGRELMEFTLHGVFR